MEYRVFHFPLFSVLDFGLLGSCVHIWHGMVQMSFVIVGIKIVQYQL